MVFTSKRLRNIKGNPENAWTVADDPLIPLLLPVHQRGVQLQASPGDTSEYRILPMGVKKPGAWPDWKNSCAFQKMKSSIRCRWFSDVSRAGYEVILWFYVS